MRGDGRIIDDLARLAGGAAGTLNDMRSEARDQVRARLARLMGEMNLVTREELDAVHEMAANARAEQERLTEEVAALKKEIAALKKKPARSRTAKTPKDY